MPAPTPENGCMFQAFEWNIPADFKHWARLTGAMSSLRSIGLTSMWIPPPCKAKSDKSNGYDIYDLWDLGEFGGNPYEEPHTKWGTKTELLALCAKAREVGVGIYLDAVLNHKAGADKTEDCMAVEVDPNDRLREISPVKKIAAWVNFYFPGRKGTYSSMEWHWQHFSGTDWDQNTQEPNKIYRFVGTEGHEGIPKHFSTAVDNEHGNYDYLMYSDIDYANDEVTTEVIKWGGWVAKELQLAGMRFDAVKHYDENFLHSFVQNIYSQYSPNFYCVGEFWEYDLQRMLDYLDRMKLKFGLFDAPLVNNFHKASWQDWGDLGQIFSGSLVQVEPVNAVTLVMNHDTQPGQSLALAVEDWFKPLAYALILLRAQGYPCVFYGDLFGMGAYKKDNHENPAVPPTCGGQLADFCLARKLYAYGDSRDYFDFPTCIGWVRTGTHDRKDGCAVVISNGGDAWKKMEVGKDHAGEVWTELLNWSKNEVRIQQDGWATFNCPGKSVSLWARKDAPGRDQFGKGFPTTF